MASLKHVHEYERSKTNQRIYRCIHPECTHFIKRDLLIGKNVVCSKCKEIFPARQNQLRAGQKVAGTKTLTCLACCKSPGSKNIIAAKEFLKDILIDFDKVS
jgi:hypothetical protein